MEVNSTQIKSSKTPDNDDVQKYAIGFLSCYVIVSIIVFIILILERLKHKREIFRLHMFSLHLATASSDNLNDMISCSDQAQGMMQSHGGSVIPLLAKINAKKRFQRSGSVDAENPDNGAAVKAWAKTCTRPLPLTSNAAQWRRSRSDDLLKKPVTDPYDMAGDYDEIRFRLSDVPSTGQGPVNPETTTASAMDETISAEQTPAPIYSLQKNPRSNSFELRQDQPSGEEKADDIVRITTPRTRAQSVVDEKGYSTVRFSDRRKSIPTSNVVEQQSRTSNTARDSTSLLEEISDVTSIVFSSDSQQDNLVDRALVTSCYSGDYEEITKPTLATPRIIINEEVTRLLTKQMSITEELSIPPIPCMLFSEEVTRPPSTRMPTSEEVIRSPTLQMSIIGEDISKPPNPQISLISKDLTRPPTPRMPIHEGITKPPTPRMPIHEDQTRPPTPRMPIHEDLTRPTTTDTSTNEILTTPYISVTSEDIANRPTNPRISVASDDLTDVSEISDDDLTSSTRSSDSVTSLLRSADSVTSCDDIIIPEVIVTCCEDYAIKENQTESCTELRNKKSHAM